MTPLTDAERVASVQERTRLQIRSLNQGGLSQTRISKALDIPFRTIRAVIHASTEQVVNPGPIQRRSPEMPDLWERPDLWDRYGVKGPSTPRMAPIDCGPSRDIS